jgi:hypothetical protein
MARLLRWNRHASGPVPLGGGTNEIIALIVAVLLLAVIAGGFVWKALQ